MSAAIYAIVSENHYKSNELLALLKKEGYFHEEDTIGRLHEIAQPNLIGLARDGYWYTSEQNAEVSEAIAAEKPTFLAHQWLRNRH